MDGALPVLSASAGIDRPGRCAWVLCARWSVDRCRVEIAGGVALIGSWVCSPTFNDHLAPVGPSRRGPRVDFSVNDVRGESMDGVVIIGR